MRNILKNRLFLKKLSKGTKLILKSATTSELSVLSEICKNISKIPFSGPAHKEVLKHIHLVYQIGRTNKCVTARDLLIILARTGVLRLIVAAALSLFKLK